MWLKINIGRNVEKTREGCDLGCLFGGLARWPNRVKIFIGIRLTGVETKPRHSACCGQGISASQGTKMRNPVLK